MWTSAWHWQLGIQSEQFKVTHHGKQHTDTHLIKSTAQTTEARTKTEWKKSIKKISLAGISELINKQLKEMLKRMSDIAQSAKHMILCLRI